MNKFNTIFKKLSSCVLIGVLFSICFATTTQKGQDIFNQLKNDGRTNEEIRQAMKDLGYNPDEYLGNTSSTVKVINSSSNSNTSSNKTTKLGRETLNWFRQEGRTDDEIKQAIEDLGYDSSAYFPTSNSTSYSNVYISRSCKPYIIEYVQTLNAYTSPDFNKKEYFINIDYLKRYIDSKNIQSAECYINGGRISSSYEDSYKGTDHYTAPNGKMYFIINNNGLYTSNELKYAKNFSTINELKNYIKERNPLVWMGNNTKSQTNYLNEIYQTITHGSATKEEDQKLDNSDEAKRIRDITRKTDLSQIQIAIINSQNDKGEWPQNSIAKSGMKISGITTELLTAGMTAVPTDPDNSNIVDGLGNTKGIGEYIYLVTNRNGVKDAGFALMAKTETADVSNWITCDGEKNLDNGYITSSNDLNEIQLCTSLIKSNSCYRDNQGRVNSQKCYYSDENQLRYLVVY